MQMINRMDNKIITAIASYGMSGQVFHGPLLRVNSNFKVAAVLE
jgi:scyllo-inositol 2-dehydrogenase (NADP+)